MHLWASEQPVLYGVMLALLSLLARTIHQSLMQNNSSADSSHKDDRRRFLPLIIVVIWAADHLLRCWTAPAYMHACLSQLLLLLLVFYLVKSPGKDGQDVSTADKSEALISCKRLWQTCFVNRHCLHASPETFTEGGRVFGLRMNYGCHMSKAGGHSSARVLFKDG